MKHIKNHRSRGEVNNTFKLPGLTTTNHNINYRTTAGVSIMKTSDIGNDYGPNIMLNRKQVWAEYLETIPWNKFITLTTSYEMTLKSARRLFERFHNDLQIHGQKNWSFWAGEKHKLRDSFHIHGFLMVSAQWCSETLELLWDKVSISQGKSTCIKNGRPHHISQFKKRDPKKKCAWYVMKDCGYTVKELCQHDFDLYTKRV